MLNDTKDAELTRRKIEEYSMNDYLNLWELERGQATVIPENYKPVKPLWDRNLVKLIVAMGNMATAMSIIWAHN